MHCATLQALTYSPDWEDLFCALKPRITSLSRLLLHAISDDLLPENSHDTEVPRFVWFGRKGTAEWVQYDFPQPKEVHSVQVYWALRDDDANPGKLPKSWRLLYRDGNNWKQVTSPD